MHSYVSDLPLGEILVRAGFASQTQIDDAVAQNGTRQRLLGKSLVATGIITQRQLQLSIDAQAIIRDGLREPLDVFKALNHAAVTDCDLNDAFITRGGMGQSCRLGEMLLEAGRIERETLEDLQILSRDNGEPLGALLVERGIVDATYLEAALELQVRVRDGMFTREQAIQALKQDPRRLLDMIAPHIVSPQNTQNKSGLKLGELFVRAGILKKSDIKQALELSLNHNHPIGQMLVARNFITHSLLDAALSIQQMMSRKQLGAGEGTACLVKVYNGNKSVSEALLELNMLKSEGENLPPRAFDAATSASAKITSTQLPAMVPQIDIARAEERERLAKQIEDLISAFENSPSYEEFNDFEGEYYFDQAHKIDLLTHLHDLHARMGRQLLKRREYGEAEKHLKAACLLAQNLGLTNAKDVDRSGGGGDALVRDRQYLACLYLKQNKSWQAEKLLRWVLDDLERKHTEAPSGSQISKAHLGLVNHRLALCYCHLGLMFKAEKHFKQAAECLSVETSLQENIDTPPRVLLERERSLARVLRDHAVLLSRLKREQEADRLYTEAKKILSLSMQTWQIN